MSYGGVPRDYKMPTVHPDDEDTVECAVSLPDYMKKVQEAYNCPVIEKADTCQHEWKAYVGLSESFSYCVICDEKKE
jgi:hypothetical protein